MKRIASELLVERLIDWGVDTVLGIRDRLCQVHRTARCLPRHLGLYDAKLDHAPVLAITGMQSTSLLGTGYQQEVHLDRVFEDVAEYNAMVHVPVSIPALVDKAVSIALARRTVTHITFPVDIQEADPELNPFEGGLAVGRAPSTDAVRLQPTVVPTHADLRAAAEVLNDAGRVALLVGAGALGAGDEVLSVADVLAAPIVKSLLGKAVVPDEHPLTTGGLGLLGTRPSEDVMDGCDALLMVGTSFPFTAFLPEKARVVQIESDPTRAGARIPTAVPLVGDATETLRALLPLLERKHERAFLEDAQEGMVEWRQRLAALESPHREPIQPQYLARLLDRHAAADAILCSDSGTIATWAARHFAALARGARAVLIGRAYLYGLAAAGEPGVRHAIDILSEELRTAMALMGSPTVQPFGVLGDESTTSPPMARSA